MNDTSGQKCSGSSESAGPPSSSVSKSPPPKSSATKERDRVYQMRYRRKNRAKDLVRHARFRAAKRGIPFNLMEFLPQIQARIDRGTCELSGLPFNLDNGRTWDSPSLDRIKPNVGYLYENIRVVCHAVNSAVGDWGEEKMLEIAEAILSRRRSRSNELSEKLGQSLMRSLETTGSPLYALTWSKRATPSGHVFYQQRASGRRISASVYGGWPTPDSSMIETADPERILERRAACKEKHQNGNGFGLNLANAAVVYPTEGWATASARDWKNGQASEATMQRNSRPLNEVAVSGLTAPGSHAATGKRGQLNPDFSRYLQGFPEGWGSYAPTGTASSRKSARRS